MNFSGNFVKTYPATAHSVESMDVYECGTVNRGKSQFTVKRLVFRGVDGAVNSVTTKLVGDRGAEYILSPMIGADGARKMYSFNTGATYRVRGNIVKVKEVDGIVTFLN